MINTAGLVVKNFPAHSPIPAAIDRAAKAWDSFCNLSWEEKKKTRLPEFETDWLDAGLWCKSPEEGYDGKYFFHYFPKILILYEMKGVHDLHPVFERFLSAAHSLSFHLTEYLRSAEFCGFLTDPYEEILLKRLIERSLSLFTIRFLNYDEGVIGDRVAKDHVDKTGLSMPCYSTHSGLQIDVGYSGSPRNERTREWKNLEISDGTFALWGGYQLHQWSRGNIWPLAHQVISTTAERRQSIVPFVPLFGVHRLPKDQRMIDLMEKYHY